MADVNMNIVDGQAFFAHETSVNYTPTQIMLDFNSVTPRTDPRNKQGATFILAHNLIMLDPYHAKQVHKILGEAIKKFEQDYAKIDKPKSVLKAEKKNKTKTEKATETEIPHYIG